MKILIIATSLDLSPDLALRMKNEGNAVIVAEKHLTKFLEGTIDRVPFEDRFKYFKKVDFVYYYDGGFGDEPIETRKIVPTLGGSKIIDKMEFDRPYGSKLAEACGLKVPEIHDITSFDGARQFIKDNPKRWVMKQQGKLDAIKGLNFVAKMDDSKDLLDHLDWIESKWVDGLEFNFILQEFIEGHELAVGAYWNGKEFMKDEDGDEVCEENWEHKALFPGDLGTSTGEQFTIMRYRKAKESKLFKETLDKCRDVLFKSEFIGNVDINCKINESGAYFLEWTNRVGNPAQSAQIGIQKTLWGEFLKSVAEGKQIGLRYNPGFCIVTWVYTSPFPHETWKKFEDLIIKSFEGKKDNDSMVELMNFKLHNSEDIVVNFKEKLTKEELNHIHMDGVKYSNGKLVLANPHGYVLTVTAVEDDVYEASRKLEELCRKLVVPKIFWRNDFGAHYFDSKEDLTEWGYLDPIDVDKKIKDIKKELNKLLA